MFNFVDMLSHARTDMNMIKQLAPDEAAYRGLTLTWYNHSSLKELLTELAKTECNVVITTDHGTVRVQKPVKIIGDKETSMNLRYKSGKSLTYQKKDVISCKHPDSFELPSFYGLNSSYIFAKNNVYFVYKNNFNH